MIEIESLEYLTELGI